MSGAVVIFMASTALFLAGFFAGVYIERRSKDAAFDAVCRHNRQLQEECYSRVCENLNLARQLPIEATLQIEEPSPLKTVRSHIRYLRDCQKSPRLKRTASGHLEWDQLPRSPHLGAGNA